ncbi:MAG TPA: SufE family protein [Candidatus Saccharimonadales bacterium]|nr:SufE family protein [Candidatus Saccharimonadales bacterium]
MKLLPDRLESIVSTLEGLDRSDRIQMLIEVAGQFKPVPPRIAERPYPESNRVPGCESDAYVWPEVGKGNTLTFHFAVENPQGISAMALAAILGPTLSGAPLEQVAQVPADMIYRIFGRELSMGKSLGLMQIVNMVRIAALKRIQATTTKTSR